jgi:hypothetical protein
MERSRLNKAVFFFAVLIADFAVYVLVVPVVDRMVPTQYGSPGFVVRFFMALITIIALVIFIATNPKDSLSYPADKWK